MKIAVDIDGVMADFATPANAFMASLLGVEPVEPYQWEWYHQYGDEGEQAWKRLWKLIAADPEWFTTLEPIPGAVEGVQALVEAGHDVEFVTARNPRYYGVTRLWFDTLDLDLPVHCHRDKWELGHDALLDDNVDNVDLFHSHGGKACLFLQTWNTDDYWRRFLSDRTLDIPAVVDWPQYAWHMGAVEVEA